MSERMDPDQRVGGGSKRAGGSRSESGSVGGANRIGSTFPRSQYLRRHEKAAGAVMGGVSEWEGREPDEK